MPLAAPCVGLSPLPVVWAPRVPPASIPAMFDTTPGEFVGGCWGWAAAVFGEGFTTTAEVALFSVLIVGGSGLGVGEASLA